MYLPIRLFETINLWINTLKAIPYSPFPLHSSLFILPSSFFPIPHSPFPIPYSPFPIPSSFFPLHSSLFILPHSPFPVPSAAPDRTPQEKADYSAKFAPEPTIPHTPPQNDRSLPRHTGSRWDDTDRPEATGAKSSGDRLQLT